MTITRAAPTRVVFAIVTEPFRGTVRWLELFQREVFAAHGPRCNRAAYAYGEHYRHIRHIVDVVGRRYTPRV